MKQGNKQQIINIKVGMTGFVFAAGFLAVLRQAQNKLSGVMPACPARANGAGTTNILLVAISSIVVLVASALDKVSGFAILDIQFKLLTPPALTLL